MKPETAKADEDGDHEGDCLSPIEEDGGMLAADGVDLKSGKDAEAVNGTDGLCSEDAETYEGGIDGVGTDGLDSANAMRRHRHNIKEKERKEKIKFDMQEIQSLLPPSQVTDKRQTMHELLQLGIQHIRYLSEQNNQLTTSGGGNNNELERLRKENEELRLESSRYRALIAASGLPVGVDTSQLVITWRYRTLEEMGNPFLFAQNGQQMATGVLPPVSVENGQHQEAPDVSQHFSGQISYATSDASTSQYMMYTDLLNSSDPSCMALTPNEQQNSFPPHATSLVAHNGHLMLVSQPQMSMQALPVSECQGGGGQNVDNQNAADQQMTGFQSAGNETTIDRKQLEESCPGLAMSGGGGIIDGNTANAIAVSASEISASTDNPNEMQENSACTDSSATQEMTRVSDQTRSVEMTTSGQEFYPIGMSSVQVTMTPSSSATYSDCPTLTNNTFEQQNCSLPICHATSTSGSIVVSNAGGDGQLQGSYGGQSVVVHNGQVLLVNQNQNIAPQPLVTSIGGAMIGQDFSGAFCQNPNPQLATTNLPLQGTSNPTNTVYLNKPHQFSSQPVTFFSRQSPALPSALLQPPLASNQTVTVNTPQGPMIMHTLPSKPNEHPQALILPDGQIVPVVTQPNLLFPPQQCIPVTGSLLVPSVTPSRLAPGLIQNPGQNALAAKLVDGKGHSFALPPNQQMQLSAAGIQPFTNNFPQVLSGVDSAKLCTTTSLQAVPAQGHLPLPALQPCSTFSKASASRSKKKPSGAGATSSKATTLPPMPGSFTAMVMPEGNILLLPGGDVPQNTQPSSHMKPAQRPLMPKPMPKVDGATPHLAPALQPLTSGVPTTPVQLTPVPANSNSSQLMSPLTISLPNTPVLPFSCTAVPATSANSTDILAKATESLFTISPNNQNSMASEMYPPEMHDNQLHIDIGSAAAAATGADSLPQNDMLKIPEKLKKSSKKKKSTKPKAASAELALSGMGDQHSLSLPLFSPGGKPEEERESDINDFADLIRMEPPTPAPEKSVDASDSIVALAGSEKENVAKEPTKSKLLVANESTLSNASPIGQETESKSSIGASSPNTSNRSANTSTKQSNCSTTPSVLLPSETTTPVECAGDRVVPSIDTKISKNVPAAEAELANDSKQHSHKEKNSADRSSGKKSSPRKKKKSQKLQENLEIGKDSENKTQGNVDCIDVLDTVHHPLSTLQLDGELLSKNSESETKAKILSPLTAGKCVESNDVMKPSGENECETAQRVLEEAPNPVAGDSVKSERSSAGHRDRKAGKSGKKEKGKTENALEEKILSKSPLIQSNVEVEEPVEVEKEEGGNRRGFALSNFLPAACKPLDAPKTSDIPLGKGSKRTRAPEEGILNYPEAEKASSDSVEKIEEATQTVRKELKGKSHDDADSDGRGKKRHKRPSEHVQEEIPEMLTFAESEIFDVVDKVENMAAATQTEPKRKSHSRKHKSSCDREGSSSSKRMKKNDKHGSTSGSATGQSDQISTGLAAPLPDVPSTQAEASVTSTKTTAIDVFSFEADDCADVPGVEVMSCRGQNKKLSKIDVPEKAKEKINNTTVAETGTTKPKEPITKSLTSSQSLPSDRKTKLSFFASPGDASCFVSPENDEHPLKSKTTKVSTTATTLASSVVAAPEVTSALVYSEAGSAESSESRALSTCKTVTAGRESSAGGCLATEKGARQSSVCAWDRLEATKDLLPSFAVDVPYSKGSEALTHNEPKDSPSCPLPDVASSKASAGKARHTNIVSLAGSLTPKSAVTKLSSHTQRNKVDREGTKEMVNVVLESDKTPCRPKESEGERRLEVTASVPSLSSETQHLANTREVVSKETPIREMVPKETVARETVDNQFITKSVKERTHREKEPSSTKERSTKNDVFNQESLPTSNTNHYLTSQPILSQCAYNDTYKKSCTPSSHNGQSSSTSTEPGISLSSSRSGISQKSGGMQTSAQNGVPSKMGAGYGSAVGGVEMERKSWQEESRRRNDPDYFAVPMSSSVPSCAVQNKNSAAYSCSSIFPSDKIGMAHQQADSANFAGGFSGLAPNSFYPQPSGFRGLDQMSPCGGDSMTRGTMSSCSVDKHSSSTKTGNQPGDGGAMRRDMSKTNQHDSYFSSHLLEPTASSSLGSMNRDKSSCLGNSMSSQTNSRQPVPNSSSVSRSHSHNRSPSIAEQPSPYSALSSYHATSVPGSLPTTILHHPAAMSDYGRYSNSSQLGFDMFQPPGSQFNPHLSGLTFDPPPLNDFRDCSSVGTQSKKSSSKPADSGFETTSKSTASRISSQQPSNQSQSCKNSSNRSASKSSSSSSKKSTKPLSSYGMESGMFDPPVTPFFGLGGLSPPRTVPPEGLYFGPPNFFGNTGRTLSNAKTVQHRDTPLPLNTALFSSSRAAQNGFGFNFQPGFGMDHVHGSHMASSQVIPPPPSANTMPAHMHGFGFGNIFSDLSSATQRDPLSMSPIKLAGGMETNTLHHHHHQGAGSMYNGRGQLPAHMLSDMGFNPFLGAQHPGFDTRSIGTPFGGHGPGPSWVL